MKVLVAGATGAIGRRLTPVLVREGHDVVGMTRSESKVPLLRSLGAEPVVCDALAAEKVRAAVAAADPDVIIHQLTDLPGRLKPNRLARYYAANNRVRKEGTLNLLAGAREVGVGRMIAQSAAFWYRPEGGMVKTEADPMHTEAGPPIGEAARTMQEIESALLAEPDVNAVSLRYGAFYGPGTWYAARGDIGRQVAIRRYPLVGRGEGVTSFVHIDDAAEATVAALRAPPGVYNVADDEPARLNDWLPAFAKALGARPPRRVPASLARMLVGSAPVEWLETQRGADNTKAKRDLDWRLRYPTWRDGFLTGLGD